jgi:hypothetical protein
LRKCISLEPRADVRTLFIASYPKSGTTWMQAVVFHILSRGQLPLQHISQYSPFYEIDKTWNDADDNVLDMYTANHKLLGWRVFNTHLLPSMIPTTDSKVIYVIRNGRDVAVSFYHHLSNQIGDGGISQELKEFLVEWTDGSLPFGSWLSHLRSWLRAAEISQNILLIRYEEMKNDLSTSITKIASFLGENLSENRLAELSSLLSFHSMKENKQLYEPISVQWKEGFEFLRKGEVGDSSAHFYAEEELLIEGMLSREFPQGIPDWFSSLGVL